MCALSCIRSSLRLYGTTVLQDFYVEHFIHVPHVLCVHLEAFGRNSFTPSQDVVSLAIFWSILHVTDLHNIPALIQTTCLHSIWQDTILFWEFIHIWPCRCVESACNVVVRYGSSIRCITKISNCMYLLHVLPILQIFWLIVFFI